jgi:hypothetical protein
MKAPPGGFPQSYPLQGMQPMRASRGSGSKTMWPSDGFGLGAPYYTPTASFGEEVAGHDRADAFGYMLQQQPSQARPVPSSSRPPYSRAPSNGHELYGSEGLVAPGDGSFSFTAPTSSSSQMAAYTSAISYSGAM